MPIVHEHGFLLLLTAIGGMIMLVSFGTGNLAGFLIGLAIFAVAGTLALAGHYAEVDRDGPKPFRH
jgi:hypothetical protein